MADNKDFTFTGAGVDFAARAKSGLAKIADKAVASDQFAEIDQKLEAALAASTTIEAKKIAGRKIRESLSEVMADDNAEAARLADIVASIHELTVKQGSELSSFENMHPRAKAIVENAELELKNAKTAVADARPAITDATAKLAVAKAKSSTFAFMNGRQADIDAANAELEEAEAVLKSAEGRVTDAETALKEAPAAAARLHRELLLAASADESSQEIRVMQERATNVLRNRLETATSTLSRRVQVIDVSRKRLEVVIKEADQSRTDFAVQQLLVNNLQAKLDSGQLEQNTPEYKGLQTQLSEATAKLGQIKAQIDGSTGEAQELEEKLFTAELQRDSLITLKGNYERTIRIGTVAAKFNQEIAAVRLELAKGLSDLSIQTELNSVSRDEAVKAAQSAADAINAIERARVTYGKQHPETMRAMLRIQKGLEGALEYVNEEDQALLEEWRKGIALEEGDALPAEADAPAPSSTARAPAETGSFAL